MIQSRNQFLRNDRLISENCDHWILRSRKEYLYVYVCFYVGVCVCVLVCVRVYVRVCPCVCPCVLDRPESQYDEYID